jgi:hypothetical protein
MTPYQIWRKMIREKVYNKTEITKRVNAVFAVGQLNETEYTELINLIDEVYSETA